MNATKVRDVDGSLIYLFLTIFWVGFPLREIARPITDALLLPAGIMSESMSFPPPDATISEIRTEQSLLDGTVIAGAAYGEVVCDVS